MKITKNRYLKLREYLKKNPIKGCKLVDDFSVLDFKEKVGSLDFDYGDEIYFGVDLINLKKNTFIWAVFPFAIYGDVTEEMVKNAYNKIGLEREIRYLQDECDSSVIVELDREYSNSEIRDIMSELIELNKVITREAKPVLNFFYK